MEFTDPQLFDKIRQGDPVAFNRLFDEAYVPLCFFANRYLKDMDLSRSVVQQLFVDLWVKRDKLAMRFHPKSYLFNAVKNRCIDVIRKEQNATLIAEVHENIQAVPFRDLVEEAELNERINAAIQALPDRCRQIFLLCRTEELKYSEIAEKLNLSVKTVEMQMGIALRKLRASLVDYQMFNLFSFVFVKKK